MTTVFLSGQNDPFGILTYDWTTMQYTKHTAHLTGNRMLSACALLKGSNGNILVAVAGGPSPGMEVWNPVDDSVVTLTDNFPKNCSREYPQMISVNKNTELIFYESSNSNGQPKGVWKYNTSTPTWTNIGHMLFLRGSFSVLPIDGVSCPE
jgi:hypothetical protein